jgi:hypothetical protein
MGARSGNETGLTIYHPEVRDLDSRSVSEQSISTTRDLLVHDMACIFVGGA